MVEEVGNCERVRRDIRDRFQSYISANRHSSGQIKAIKKVIIVASSSRGGSTLFSEYLRRSENFVHLNSEVNHLFRMVSSEYLQESDALKPEMVDQYLDEIRGEFCGELGYYCKDLTTLDIEWFVQFLAYRLSLQWPDKLFSTLELRIFLNDFVAKYKDVPYSEWQIFYEEQLLEYLVKLECDIRCYDVTRGKNTTGLDLPREARSLFFEEQPFVLPMPWIRWNGDIETPLVIKTPSNNYRLKEMQKIFSGAEFKVIHLVRNVAAAMNGMADGWLHWGFHSYFDSKIAIRCPEGNVIEGWWSFDRPPGWRKLFNSSLLEVTLFQWMSAHDAILNFRQNHLEKNNSFVLRYESLIDRADRVSVFESLLSWLEIAMDRSLQNTLQEGLAWQMATRAPAERRWMKRESLIRPLIKQPSVQAMMVKLGYSLDDSAWV